MTKHLGWTAVLFLCIGCAARDAHSPVSAPAVPATKPAPAASATEPAQAAEKWTTLIDARRHFRLDYPASWKVNTQVENVAHYSAVFAALNSAGKEGFTVREMQVGPGTWELSPEVVSRQLPAGAAYVDVSWFEGLTAQFGPGVREMEGADLSGPLKESAETWAGKLTKRSIGFSKWGKHWTVTVYVHTPAADALRRDVDRVLASFRFDGVPAGDEVWAIGRALKSLPAEADPEKYTRQGGSSEYSCAAKADGDAVVVTFTKQVGAEAAKSWNYRVTATGEVIAVGSD
jgi:hypothetical protein